MLSVKQGGSSTNFWVFGMTRPGIEPNLPDHLQTLYELGKWLGIYISFNSRI